MKRYLTSEEMAKIWGGQLNGSSSISARTVRLYCSQGRVFGAFLDGKTWMIPEDAKKPERKKRVVKKKRKLLDVLLEEKDNKISGGIYHKLQVDITYNSNHIEGSKLTHDQTRYIFETKTIGKVPSSVKIDDIVETSNHFSCVDLMIDLANAKLTEALIKQIHFVLKSGTSDSKTNWFKVGDYKKYENVVGDNLTAKPSEVKDKMKELLKWYNSLEKITENEIIEFHYHFEKIHPFQDGNGRVGRLIMLKECLKNNIVPILILDEYKFFYYRGLKEWENDKAYLLDICLNGQDIMKKYLDTFEIEY